jgi:hypothetical protein
MPFAGTPQHADPAIMSHSLVKMRGPLDLPTVRGVVALALGQIFVKRPWSIPVLAVGPDPVRHSHQEERQKGDARHVEDTINQPHRQQAHQRC